MHALMSDPQARDAIVASVISARGAGKAGAVDGATSGTLKHGRKAVFVHGSQLQIVLVHNDAFHGFDVLRFYNANGVLAHEEAAGEDRLAAIGMSS